MHYGHGIETKTCTIALVMPFTLSENPRNACSEQSHKRIQLTVLLVAFEMPVGCLRLHFVGLMGLLAILIYVHVSYGRLWSNFKS